MSFNFVSMPVNKPTKESSAKTKKRPPRQLDFKLSDINPNLKYEEDEDEVYEEIVMYLENKYGEIIDDCTIEICGDEDVFVDIWWLIDGKVEL